MIAITTASLTDLDQLVPLFDAYRVFYRKPSNPVGAEQFLKDRILGEESLIFLASYTGKVCGFTQLYPLFSSTNMAPLLLLNDLYVAPEYRGKSIGKALLKHAQDYAQQQGVKGISLETEKTNAIGNGLYPKMGFEKDTEHHFYFWENPTF